MVNQGMAMIATGYDDSDHRVQVGPETLLFMISYIVHIYIHIDR